MSGPAKFDEPRYELRLPGGTVATLRALMSEEALRLSEAIAAMDPWRAYGYPASALHRMLAAHEAGAPRFALLVEGNVVGAAVIRTAWLRGPYLQFIALLPEAQRRGIGTAFLDWMEREARAGKERNLWVAASEINVDAIRLYERHGFIRVAALDDLVCHERVELLFRKRLA